MSRLNFKIESIKDVKQTDIERMQKLFLNYYDLPNPDDFFRDFQKKDHVIILRDKRSGEIQGFSTQKIITHNIQGRVYQGVFSGDTLVDKNYWGDPALGFGFFCYLMKINLRHPTQKLYWHLISKGYKTYLLLTNNFDSYYPRYDLVTPAFEQALIESFSQQLYPQEFKKDLGLLIFDGPHERLKAEVAPITQELREKNPKIDFFATRNPHWERGDELVCLGEFHLLLPLIHAKKVLSKNFKKLLGIKHGATLPSR